MFQYEYNISRIIKYYYYFYTTRRLLTYNNYKYTWLRFRFWLIYNFFSWNAWHDSLRSSNVFQVMHTYYMLTTKYFWCIFCIFRGFWHRSEFSTVIGNYLFLYHFQPNLFSNWFSGHFSVMNAFFKGLLNLSLLYV